MVVLLTNGEKKKVMWAIEFVITTEIEWGSQQATILEHCNRFLDINRYANIPTNCQLVVNFCVKPPSNVHQLQIQTPIPIVHCVFAADFSSFNFVFGRILPDANTGFFMEPIQIQTQTGKPVLYNLDTRQITPFPLNHIPAYQIAEVPKTGMRISFKHGGIADLSSHYVLSQKETIESFKAAASRLLGETRPVARMSCKGNWIRLDEHLTFLEKDDVIYVEF